MPALHRKWSLRSAAIRAAAMARDAWLVVGVTLLLIVVVELAYRGQAALRQSVSQLVHRAPQAVKHPYADSAWFAGLEEEFDHNQVLRWSSYVYFRRPAFAGAHINIDGAGLRRTVQPAPTARVVRPVYFFGGSTMWGQEQRDAATIPSLAASRLARDGNRDVLVTNFGETGYVFTQGFLTLMLQLRAGARPAVVVFYDGINDVRATIQDGKAGVPTNEYKRTREFSLGRVMFDDETSLASDGLFALEVAQLAGERLEFVGRLRDVIRPKGGVKGPPTDSLVTDLVHTYVETARLIEALGATYGFRTVYVWQPTLQVTPKPLSPFERSITDGESSDQFWRRSQEMHRAARAPLQSAMQAVAPKRFLDLSDLFKGDTNTVFLDQIGHTTERANGPIVDAIAPVVEAALNQGAGAPKMR